MNPPPSPEQGPSGSKPVSPPSYTLSGEFFGVRLPKAEHQGMGLAAGIEHHELSSLEASSSRARVRCIDYSADRFERREVTDIDAFLAEHRPGWTTVRWIDVEGINDAATIRALAEKYSLHPLAIEDVVHVPQRPKVEDYPGQNEHNPRLFFIARMFQLEHDKLHSEQVSMFLGLHTLLTFQERGGDVWDPVRLRIATAGSRVRTNDASFLLYALVDTMIDECFPILEHFSEQLEDLEESVLESPSHKTIHQVHRIKRELLLVRRAAWPMREAIARLGRERHECMSETTRTYLRDVYDHAIQIIDLIETYREFASGLTETYMSSVSFRMNEVMKVLTIIGTIFIPLTFLAGVYGMNMQIPEAQYSWMYPAFWLICVATAGAMVFWFKRRGWL